MHMNRNGKLFIISAPSGAGKTTLAQALLERFGRVYMMERVVTYTSKKPRTNERHGIDYHFICANEFECKVQEGFFMEWSTSYDTYYGSPRSVLDGIESGKSYILILDRAGALNVAHTCCADAVLIWLYTKSIEDLRIRLEGRNTETKEQIDRRLEIAKQEVEAEFLSPEYHYHVLNNDFERALKKLERIVKRELL